jgi:hypothetical protein
MTKPTTKKPLPLWVIVLVGVGICLAFMAIRLL